MTPFTPEALQDYLSALHRGEVGKVRITPLGGGRQGDKGYGYGVPLRVDYELGGTPRRAVLETVRPGPFGHEHMADRAQLLLWAHGAFNRLPRHVPSLDVGAVRAHGALESLGSAEELFMLAQFIEGREYADDLLRLRGARSQGPVLRGARGQERDAARRAGGLRATARAGARGARRPRHARRGCRAHRRLAAGARLAGLEAAR